jgi:hypothetical protein
MVAEPGVVQAQAQVSIIITIFDSCFQTKPCPVLEIAVFFFCYREHHEVPEETSQEERMTRH